MKYEYVREMLPNGAWDIDNPNRKDSEGNEIPLATEVGDALPNRIFKIRCKDAQCEIEFDIELTDEDAEILDAVVDSHKKNL